MASASAAIEQKDIAKQAYGKFAGNRWIQLVCGVVAMIVISNYQYAFTLFTPGMRQTFPGVPYAKIAAIFSAFILFETWLSPVSGYFVDRFGIRKLMALGAVLIGLGWVLGGTIAHSIFHLYLYYGVVAGTGAGVIYISCVANAVKWFPDKRGLAAGLTAAGFGGGAALTIMPIAHSINTIGWASTMAIWGAAQGVIALLAAMMLRHPPAGWAPMGWDSTKKKAKTGVVQSKVNFTWTQTLRRPEFYLLYIMFLFAMMGGLIATANLSQIARSLNVNNAKVLGLAIIPLTATLASACNALSRIAWGTISDKLGRENTMFVAFGAEAILVYLVTRIAGKPITFVVLFSLIFLFWGEVYSLFSAATGDVFGPKNATGNYGMLYTAKGLASILAGFGAAALAAYFAGSFAVSFYASSILCAVASLFALFVLKPMVRARIAKEVPLAAAQAVGKASAAVAGGS